MAGTTRARLINTAHDLFYRTGFHSVGLDAILAHVGLSKTAFYKHFASKEDLVAEVLRWHDRWWQDTFRQMLRRHGGDSARGQLLAVFDALDELFGLDGYNGCFFINVAVQFPLPHDPAHRAAAAHKESMENIVRELAAYAGAADPRRLAKELCLLLEGAYVTRQVTGDPQTAEIARRVGSIVLENDLPAQKRTHHPSAPSAPARASNGNTRRRRRRRAGTASPPVADRRR
jgi:AcrR family transcriptional regulator